MNRQPLLILFLALLFVGCSGGGPSGLTIVGTSPEGVQTYSQGQVSQTYPWGEITRLVVTRQLNAQTKKSHPVLRLSTEKANNKEIASSYSERVDSKSYTGQFIHLSIGSTEFEELKDTIISGAGLMQHPEDDSVWVKGKKSEPKPITENKTYSKKIED